MTHVAALLHAIGAPLARVARRAGGTVRDRGASALEFAIIAAVVVVAASVIGAVVYNLVEGRGETLTECANQPINEACGPGGGAPPAGG